MKKRFAIAALLVVCGLVTATTLSRSTGEYKQYAPDPQPGELYFIALTNVDGQASVTITNQEDHMWWPRVRVTYPASASATTTLDHVWTHTQQDYLVWETETDEWGNTATNWLHALTNTVTTYKTNRVLTVTNTSAASAFAEAEREYIQRGDILIFTFGNTNLPWMKITGMR